MRIQKLGRKLVVDFYGGNSRIGGGKGNTLDSRIETQPPSRVINALRLRETHYAERCKVECKEPLRPGASPIATPMAAFNSL